MRRQEAGAGNTGDYNMTDRLERALTLISLLKFNEAEKELRLHLAGSPADSQAHAALSTVLLKLGDEKEARAEAGRAIGLDPDNAYAHYALAQALLPGDSLKAEEELREALRLEPLDPAYHSALADIYFRRGDHAKAVEIVRKALEFAPESSALKSILGEALYLRDKLAEAEEAVNQSLSDNPESPVAHYLKGIILLKRGKYDEAFGFFKEGLRLNPRADYIREEMITALKARHWYYRWVFRTEVWNKRFPVAGVLLLAAVLLSTGIWLTDLLPAAAFTIVFGAALAEACDHLSKFSLGFTEFGRLVISREEKIFTGLIGGTSLAGVLFAVSAAVTRSWGPMLPAGVLALMALPLSTAAEAKKGSLARNILVIYSVLLALFGIKASFDFGAFIIFFFGCVASTWFNIFRLFGKESGAGKG